MASINKNGLWSSDTVNSTGSDKSNFFLRVNNESGDVNIDGDFTVAGDMSVIGDMIVAGESTLPTITAIDISLNPIYIKNPYNLSVSEFNEMAVLVEGGAERLDISGQGVGMGTYKPFTQNAAPGTEERIGSYNFWGVDASENKVRYGRMTASATDSRSGVLRRGRLDLGVLIGNSQQTLLQLDGSTGETRIPNGSLITNGIDNTTGSVVSRSNFSVGTNTTNNVSMTFVDTSGTYTIPFSFVSRITGAIIASVLPASGTGYTFTPRYSGTYCVEMTCGFGGAGAAFNNAADAIGFVVGGGPAFDDDYGASIAAARVITGTVPTPYVATSMHTFVAGFTYTFTMRYVGAPVLGASGAFLIEVSLV